MAEYERIRCENERKALELYRRASNKGSCCQIGLVAVSVNDIGQCLSHPIFRDDLRDTFAQRFRFVAIALEGATNAVHHGSQKLRILRVNRMTILRLCASHVETSLNHYLCLHERVSVQNRYNQPLREPRCFCGIYGFSDAFIERSNRALDFNAQRQRMMQSSYIAHCSISR